MKAHSDLQALTDRVVELEDELADALACVACNHIGPFSEGPAAEPQDRERNQIYNAGFEMGLKHATSRAVSFVEARHADQHGRDCCCPLMEEMPWLAEALRDGDHLQG